VPFFPLASGLLTGKYRRDGDRPVGARLSQRDSLASEAEWNVIDGLNAFASKRDLTMTQVAIGALLARPVVSSVIAGATRPEQIGLNGAAVTWTPSPADLRELAEILAAS
jgi:aryl-alcohol dehydrogenase-like predicted oxidoreductase